MPRCNHGLAARFQNLAKEIGRKLGSERIVQLLPDQSRLLLVIDTEMLAFGVDWPGIPGDAKPFANTTYDLDLFSRSEYDDALAGDGLEWEDDDEGSEADEGK